MSGNGTGEGLRPFLDLDADIEPSGAAVRIGGREHRFKSDDELTISDRENLLLFSIRLREIRETPPDDGGLLPDEVEARIAEMQRRVLRIALPTVNRALLDDLDPLKVHAAVQAFISAIRPVSWLDRMTAASAMAQAVRGLRQMAERRGATTSTPIDASTGASGNGTPGSKPDSGEDTVLVTGATLTD
jgi:hypothetical protein